MAVCSHLHFAGGGRGHIHFLEAHDLGTTSFIDANGARHRLLLEKEFKESNSAAGRQRASLSRQQIYDGPLPSRQRAGDLIRGASHF